MNGRARDSVSSDIDQGIPALSSEADPLVVQVRNLLTETERIEFDRMLNERAAQSESWSDWVDAPTRYLSEFDPHAVSEIDADLTARLTALRDRAEERGWET